MRFKLECPEHDIRFDFPLGDQSQAVAVIGRPGIGKTLLATAMTATLAGNAPEKVLGLRGLFGGLSWMGEGSCSELAFTDTAVRTGFFHPYGADDKPNLMHFEGADEEDSSYAFVGRPDFMVFRPRTTQGANWSSAMQLAVDLTRKVCPDAVMKSPGIELVHYNNRPTVSMATSLLAITNVVCAIMHTRFIVLDLNNPGYMPHEWRSFHSAFRELAKKHKAKLITFMNKEDNAQLAYDMRVFL